MTFKATVQSFVVFLLSESELKDFKSDLKDTLVERHMCVVVAAVCPKDAVQIN